MNTPPRLTHQLLLWRIPAEHREYVMGDLEERFDDKARSAGLRAARSWFRRETFAAWTTRWDDHNLEFGNSAHGDRAMQTLIQDLRWATKVLRSTPTLTAAVILTLALAVGANTTIFSWINRVLLNPLPGVQTDGLFEFAQTSPLGQFSLSYPDYLDYRNGVKSIALAGREDYPMNLSYGNEVERLWAEVVTDNYFDVLNLKAALGRGFTLDDAKPNESPVIVISNGLWKRSFASDPATIGREVQVNGRPFTIVGVMPPGFAGTTMGLQLDVYVPMAMEQAVVPGGNRLESRGNHWFKGLARLRPGATIEQARDQINVASRVLVETVPSYREITVQLTQVRDSANGGIAILRPVLFAMITVSGVILLIACANIANLLLARATSRRREIAIRLSMGATRGRMMRQLLTEGLVLAVAGSAGGLVVTALTAGLLVWFAPPTDLPISMSVPIDSHVFVFTLLVTVLSTLLFALVPSIRLANAGTSSALKEGSGGAGTRDRLRKGLVVFQVALSLALLVAAGLCMASLKRIQAFNPGFSKEGVLLASIDLFPAGYDSKTGTQVLAQLLDELHSIPGVTASTLARHIPLGLTGLSSSSMDVDGYTPPNPDRPPLVAYTMVGPDYLDVMRIPLVGGRDLMRSDDRDAPPVAVIAESMAKQFWPQNNAVGGRFRFGSNSPWITVVGVAKDVKWRDVKETNRAFVYLPVLQTYHPNTNIHLRTAGDPALLAESVREVVRKVAPQIPVYSIRTLAGHVSAASFQQSMASRLLGAFGILALTLSALGLYGVLAFLVGQRTREIGIRIAVGAQPGDMVRMVVGQGLRLTGLGVVIGIAAAYGLGRAMSGLLFAVSPSDPVTIIAGSSLLVLTSIAACLIPAYRATRVDPVTALHCE